MIIMMMMIHITMKAAARITKRTTIDKIKLKKIVVEELLVIVSRLGILLACFQIRVSKINHVLIITGV